ncbi:Nitroreductase-like protein [Fusarium acuminatum]|uniref:Nitroreductase-like protein n=1 Tax=Fusarium acuminatum TaxID=5515 RepID=A0ABZ2WNG3_9HYPO
MPQEQAFERHEIPSACNAVVKTILDRHSTRAFCTGQEVPMSIIEECFSIAQHAPSSTNIQPWRVTLTSGAPLKRLSSALVRAFENKEELKIDAIPESFNRYRSELGHHVYGPNGYNIARGDTESMKKTIIDNFNFYHAPVVAVLCIDKELNKGDVLSAGIYLQTLLLLLTERGLGTQVSAAPTGYPEIIKKELGIEENMNILCTVGIGFENKSQQINSLKMPRDDWKQSVRFVME